MKKLRLWQYTLFVCGACLSLIMWHLVFYGVILSVFVWNIYSHDLTQAGRSLKLLESTYSVLPYTSLGLVRLGGEGGYTLGNEVLDLVIDVVSLSEDSMTILDGLLSGEGTPEPDMDDYVAQMVLLVDRVQVLIEHYAAAGQYSELKVGLVDFRHLLESGSFKRMLGYESEARYIILLQNNMELRASGGFLGSYALVKISDGGLKTIEVEDIYAPDGQIKGYVPEPEPIKQYLFDGQHPGWRLRDSNWDVDFRDASQDMLWFFEEGGIDEVDGLVAVNLNLLQGLLEQMGTVRLADYQIEIHADNFYEEIQREVHEKFFPGSTRKGDVLRHLATQVLLKLRDGEVGPISLGRMIHRQLSDGEIVLYMKDEALSSFIGKLGFDGAVELKSCGADCYADYIYPVESNVGINKANCCIEKQINHAVTIETGLVKHRYGMEIINHNPAVPIPPVKWGGEYKNYMRLVIPADYVDLMVVVDGVTLSDSDVFVEPVGDALMSVGFLHLVQGGMTGRFEVAYARPLREADTYGLYRQHQPGLGQIPYLLRVQDTASGVGHEIIHVFKVSGWQFVRLN